VTYICRSDCNCLLFAPVLFCLPTPNCQICASYWMCIFDEHVASIFKVEERVESGSMGLNQNILYQSLRLQGISTQKTVIFIVAGWMLTLKCHLLLWNVTTRVPRTSSWNDVRHEKNFAFPALATYWEQKKTPCRLPFCGGQASLKISSSVVSCGRQPETKIFRTITFMAGKV
jgi:hypothetical protein